MAAKPVTEQSNPLTLRLDTATPLELVRLLREVDAQMFSGWRDFAGLADASVHAALAQTAAKMAAVLRNPTGVVVMTGAGTSGRVAFMAARSFNLLLTQRGLRPAFRYLTAGDDVALFLSREAPEDNWRAGRDRLVEIVAGSDCVMLLGITCGFSAPYVAAQLDYALDHPETFVPVVLVC